MKTKLLNLIFFACLTACLSEAPIGAQNFTPPQAAEMPNAQLQELAERRALFLSENASKAPLPSKDGLELVVKPTDGQAGFGSEMTCRLVNHNKFDVRYSVRSITQGFVFFLYDAGGHKIDLDPEWEWGNMPYTHDVRYHQIRAIKPDESLEFTLNLTEAYGERWRRGKRLLVEWDPTSFRTGSEFKTGVGIRAEVLLKASVSSAERVSLDVSKDFKPQLVMQTSVPNTKPAPMTQNSDFVMIRYWGIAAFMIVVLTVLYFVFKRCW
jgi:hypothetical protein